MPVKPYEEPAPPESERNSSNDDALDGLHDGIKSQLHGNAAALYKAGVPFVLSAGSAFSDSSSIFENFLDNVRLAVDAGLPAEAALEKMTTGPAEMLGLRDVLGTIDTGKMAHLVVTEGDLFDNDSQIRHVFIDGKMVKMQDSGPSNGGKNE